MPDKTGGGMRDETINEVAEIDEAIAAAEARVIELTEAFSSAASGDDMRAEKALMASYLTSLDLLRVIRRQLLTDS